MLPKPTLPLSLFIAIWLLCTSSISSAEKKYSPNDVYAKIEYSSLLMEDYLKEKDITDLNYPSSHETTVKPMHVYELHIAALAELYKYGLKHQLSPPPLTFSSPINYTPTDVYYLSSILSDYIEGIYFQDGRSSGVYEKEYASKTPSDVYKILYRLYYQIVRLNGVVKVSPNEVYAQAYRAKEDLKKIILSLSKRLDESEMDKKRLLVTASYGMHPSGSTMSAQESGKTPRDVISRAFSIRDKLNKLRRRYGKNPVNIPNIDDYASISPADVFLQTQFIIAEINLLKAPLNIKHSTDIAVEASDKTPSDVYQEMKHIAYLLDRLTQI